MSEDRVEALLELAKELVTGTTGFADVKGPGHGDRATIAFMRQLGLNAKQLFGVELSEAKICGATGYAVDFYFEDEATIIEVALGLPNPQSEFEKDVLKALMAKEAGAKVERLVILSRPGGEKKCKQPGRAAVIKWAEIRHGLKVDIRDLLGPPRKRVRRSRSRVDSTPGRLP